MNNLIHKMVERYHELYKMVERNTEQNIEMEELHSELSDAAQEIDHEIWDGIISVGEDTNHIFFTDQINIRGNMQG